MGFQNFYQQQPQMMQYANPILANQQARLNQMEQQYQQMTQPSQPQMPVGLNGRLIDDISTVMPNETPMDGNIALFPRKDMGEIYVRQWQNDGTLITKKYVPDTEENSTPQKQVSLEDVMARLDDLESKLVAVSKTENTTKTKAKKESD